MTKAKINLNLIHIHGVKGKHLPVISDPRYFSFLFLFSFSFFFFFCFCWLHSVSEDGSHLEDQMCIRKLGKDISTHFD